MKPFPTAICYHETVQKSLICIRWLVFVFVFLFVFPSLVSFLFLNAPVPFVHFSPWLQLYHDQT